MAVAKRVDLFSKFLWNFNLVWEATGLGRLLWPRFPLWHILLHFSVGSALGLVGQQHRCRISRQCRLCSYDKCWALAMCSWVCFSFVCSANNLEGDCGLLSAALRRGAAAAGSGRLCVSFCGVFCRRMARYRWVLIRGWYIISWLVGIPREAAFSRFHPFLYSRGVEEKGGEGMREWER